MHGLNFASGEFIILMDADMSHHVGISVKECFFGQKIILCPEAHTCRLTILHTSILDDPDTNKT